MKKILLLAFVLFAVHISAQERIPVEMTNTKFYLNIITPSVAVEQRISSNQSFLARGGIRLHAEEIEDEFDAGLLPYVEAEFRNYYPRKNVKRELNNNSGNYIGFIGGYHFDHIAGNPALEAFKYENHYYFAGLWGMQRNYKSKIHLNLHVGPAVYARDGGVDFNVLFNFHFGFVIGN
ncbi:MAG: hypothetical protein HKN67_10475 [Saprospiraceae bacterium]|nr:hypothetical protein [Saprospiraceae bacterium]